MRRSTCFRLWLGTCVSVTPFFACSSKTPTQVVVELHAEPLVRNQAAKCHVRVFTSEGALAIEKTEPVSPASDSIARVPIVPKDDDPGRHFTLRAELRDASDQPLAELEVTAGFHADQLDQMKVWFQDSCLGVLGCGDGRTCSDGVCVGACFDSAASGQAKPICTRCERCGSTCETLLDVSACATFVFGNKVVGTVTAKLDPDEVNLSEMTLDSAAEIDLINVYLAGTLGSGSAADAQPIRGVLYRSVGGVPTDLIRPSEERRISPDTAPGWVALPLGQRVSLAAGKYWLGVHVGSPSTILEYRVISTDKLLYAADPYSDGTDGTFSTTPNAISELQSIYAALTPD